MPSIEYPRFVYGSAGRIKQVKDDEEYFTSLIDGWFDSVDDCLNKLHSDKIIDMIEQKLKVNDSIEDGKPINEAKAKKKKKDD